MERVRDYPIANSRSKGELLESQMETTEDKGGERIMRLAGLVQEKMRTKRRRASDGNTAMGAYPKNQKAELVGFEMALHVPCHVAGKTTSGSRWQGKTKTVALSSFGAHILLPADVDMEAEISVLFRIPSALKVLFSKDVFRVKAEVRPSGTNGHWQALAGQKIIYVAFARPLRITSWAA